MAILVGLSPCLARAQDPGMASSGVISASADNETLSDDTLELVLGPVALFPDAVLAQLLPACTYPTEVAMAAAWTGEHRDLQGIENQPWDPSVRALAIYPDVLKRMAENLDWTMTVGKLFLDDPERILDTIQRLRQKAREQGNLRSSRQVNVVTKDSTIQIEPATADSPAIPRYDATKVYDQRISPTVSGDAASTQTEVYWVDGWYYPWYWEPVEPNAIRTLTNKAAREWFKNQVSWENGRITLGYGDTGWTVGSGTLPAGQTNVDRSVDWKKYGVDSQGRQPAPVLSADKLEDARMQFVETAVGDLKLDMNQAMALEDRISLLPADRQSEFFSRWKDVAPARKGEVLKDLKQAREKEVSGNAPRKPAVWKHDSSRAGSLERSGLAGGTLTGTSGLAGAITVGTSGRGPSAPSSAFGAQSPTLVGGTPTLATGAPRLSGALTGPTVRTSSREAASSELRSRAESRVQDASERARNVSERASALNGQGSGNRTRQYSERGARSRQGSSRSGDRSGTLPGGGNIGSGTIGAGNLGSGALSRPAAPSAPRPAVGGGGGGRR